MKKYLKIISFVTILSLGFYFSNIIFNRLDRKTFNVLNFNKDKIDLIFVGSSHSYSSFNTRIFDNKLKINTYALSTDAQPMAGSYYLLKEFYKKKKVEIVVFELYGLLLEPEERGSYENIFNSFQFGKNKLEASKIFNKEERIDYLFPLLKYHSVWKEPSQIIKNTIALFYPPYKGSITYWEDATKLLNEDKVKKYREENFELNIDNVKYLKKIKKEVENNGSKLIFTVAPVIVNKGNYKVLKLKEKIKKEIPDIEILDFNSNLKELGIERSDFLDHGHLNTKGSTKVSEYFANYLGKKYKFKEKNYQEKEQLDYNERYFYKDQLYHSKGKEKIQILDNEIKNIIKISKKKNLNYMLHLLDGYNIGIITKEDIKNFLISKQRFDLYLEVDNLDEVKENTYEILLFQKDILKRKILKGNKEKFFCDKDNKNVKVVQNNIWKINGKNYLIEKNIFLDEKIDKIVIKKI
ncbi:hypothetical protein SAMN02745174_00999 [Cetobacterium ceti]|uniref:Uncharacterized protein n=1 Tax=Cetobacterium ceti TaxID=180163 RepID=A0A1T4LWJ6_9FUSO|nr:hypothetical protein [Cetobacterium ceti]SJZ59113.1 hypothetical protein SAMN02745174_00999 [Cetobacterium ceti]